MQTGLEFPEPESVLSEKAGCDAVAAAGRAVGLQNYRINRLAAGDGKDLRRPFDKGLADVQAAFGYHSGPAGKNIFTAAADNVRCFSGGWQTAKLFRADGNPGRIPEYFKAGGIWLDFTVITCAEAYKTGADEVERRRSVLHIYD